MNAEQKRAQRAAMNALGLTGKGTPIKTRRLSMDPDAVERRKRRAAARERGLNSRGKPLVNQRLAEVMAGTEEPVSREQRSWWLVTTEVPAPVAKLLEATGAWGATRFWEGDRLRPFRNDPLPGDGHEAA